MLLTGISLNTTDKELLISENRDSCMICLQPWTSSDKDLGKIGKIEPCEHLVHHICIKPWLELNKLSCPVCRVNIDNLNVPPGFEFEYCDGAKYLMPLPRSEERPFRPMTRINEHFNASNSWGATSAIRIYVHESSLPRFRPRVQRQPNPSLQSSQPLMSADKGIVAIIGLAAIEVGFLIHSKLPLVMGSFTILSLLISSINERFQERSSAEGSGTVAIPSQVEETYGTINVV